LKQGCLPTFHPAPAPVIVEEKETTQPTPSPRGDVPMIRFLCPNCRATLKAPEQLAGKFVPCPKCKTRVEVPGASNLICPSASPPAAVAAPAAQPSPPVAAPPPAIIEPAKPPVAAAVIVNAPAPALKLCPFCAEQIQAEALKCKHCGETIDPALRAAEES